MLILTDEEKIRFWEKVQKTDTCWIWTGGTFKFGHGRFWVKALNNGHYTHRIAFFLKYGHLPKPPQCILHNCPGGDNPRCVNPDHLWIGTRADNNQDKASKGRAWSHQGEDNKCAILTEKQVLEIKEKYATGAFTQTELGKLYGVSQSNVYLIVSGKNWAHLNK